MTGIAGDGHIWTITTEDVPVAACGYSPPTEDIMGPDPDPEAAEGAEVVIGQQVVHAEPTGDTCPACIDASTEPEPEE